MKKISRLFLLGALAVILLTAACAPEEGTPTVVETLPPVDLTPSPAATDGTLTAETETTSTAATLETATPAAALTETAPAATDTPQVAATDTTQTPSTPVTSDVILLECQFCVNNMAHALLVLSEVATFELTTTATGTDTGCNTVDTFDDRQVVLCRAEENTSLTLNICTDGNCTELLVDLQACPVAPGTAEPGATATETSGAAVTNTPGAAVTDTPQASPTTGGAATSTPTP